MEPGTSPAILRDKALLHPSHGVAFLCPALLLPCPSPRSPLSGSPIPPELSAYGAPCRFQLLVLTTLHSSASVPNQQPQRASHWPNPATGRFPSDSVHPARQLGRAGLWDFNSGTCGVGIGGGGDWLVLASLPLGGMSRCPFCCRIHAGPSSAGLSGPQPTCSTVYT